ncbi:MAG: TetR/AcrR family transcriptional regulator [Candidatus Geothermincolales bacterium]
MSVPKKRMSSQQRREHLLAVAAEVFAEKGYRNASVSDIVNRARIGRGTFYIYFESKSHVFLELIEEFFMGYEKVLIENHRRLMEAFRTNHRILATWRMNLEEVLRYHMERPKLTHIVYREAIGSDEDFSSRVDELSAKATRILGKEFQEMKARGLIRNVDVSFVVSTIIGSVTNAILEHLLKGKKWRPDKLADELVEYHVRALAPDGADLPTVVKIALAR